MKLDFDRRHGRPQCGHSGRSSSRRSRRPPRPDRTLLLRRAPHRARRTDSQPDDAIRVVGSGSYLIAHNSIDCGWANGGATGINVFATSFAPEASAIVLSRVRQSRARQQAVRPVLLPVRCLENRWIDDVDWPTRAERRNLVEDIRELGFVFFVSNVPDVRCADNVVHRQ
jgi:hypothetical protein